MSSQNPQFPLGKPQRTPVFIDPAQGLIAYRVVPPKQAIRPAPSGVEELDDASTFQPISAVFIEKQAARRAVQASAGCDAYEYYVNDWTSRLSLWLTTIVPAWDDNTAKGQPITNAAGVPQPFEIQVRVATDHISETVFQGLVTPSSYQDNGLLVDIDGYAGTQWEVWGRIPNGGGAAFPMELRFQFLFDRVGTQRGVPFVGRLVTVEKIQYYP